VPERSIRSAPNSRTIPISRRRSSASRTKSAEARPEPSATRAALWADFAIPVVSLGLGFVGLSRDELWFDEAYAALIAESPLRGIVGELQYDSSPPLYYVVLNFWIKLFGGGPFALRSLSVLFAGLGVYLAFRLGLRLFEPEASRYGALLLAVSPLYLYYSQQARPYALFVTLVLAALLFHEEARASSSLYPRALWSLATILAMYTHNYGLFLVPLFALSAMRDRRFLPGLCVIGIAYAPWVPLLWFQVQTGAAAWIERIWLATPPALAPFKTFLAFAGGGVLPDYIPAGGSSLWTAAVAAPLFAFLLFRCFRARETAAPSRRATAAVAILLGLPYAVSFVKPIYLVGRYDVVALPLFVLLAGAGLRTLRAPFTGFVLAALALAIVPTLARYYSRQPLSGVMAQAELVVENTTKNDVVLCTGFTRNPLEYYTHQRDGSPTFLSFPRSSGIHRGWVDERELGNRDALASDAETLLSELTRSLGGGGRIWIAHSRLAAESTEVLLHALSSRFRRDTCPGGADRQGFSCWVTSGFRGS
jgi:hypothetical protein